MFDLANPTWYTSSRSVTAFILLRGTKELRNELEKSMNTSRWNKGILRALRVHSFTLQPSCLDEGVGTHSKAHDPSPASWHVASWLTGREHLFCTLHIFPELHSYDQIRLSFYGCYLSCLFKGKWLWLYFIVVHYIRYGNWGASQLGI